MMFEKLSSSLYVTQYGWCPLISRWEPHLLTRKATYAPLKLAASPQYPNMNVMSNGRPEETEGSSEIKSAYLTP